MNFYKVNFFKNGLDGNSCTCALSFLRIISHDACHNYVFGNVLKRIFKCRGENWFVYKCICLGLIYNFNVNCEVINSNISHDFVYLEFHNDCYNAMFKLIQFSFLKLWINEHKGALAKYLRFLCSLYRKGN